MTNTSQERERTNSRITYAATPEGRKRAEYSLKRLGFASKTKFAEVIEVSRSTVTKFFGGQSIELDGFQKICHELKLLDWKEIVDIKSFDNNGKVEQKQNSCNQITEEKKVSIAITASINQKDLAKYKTISKLLKILADDDFIEVVDIEEGSIKLTLKGSPAGLQRLEQLFQSGELTKIFKQELNITVEDVSFIAPQNSDEERQNQTATTENKQLAFTIADDVNQADIDILKAALIDTSDDEEIQSDKKKSSLVKLIKTQGAKGLDLIYANLSGANLSETYLSGWNLCRANLSNVNLSDANLSGAYLFGANLIGANLIGANLSDANLSDANLSGAYLFGANLNGAYLIGANLSGAYLSNAIVKKTRFGYNEGMTKSLRDYLIDRDAIFEDSPPGDLSEVLTPA